MELEEIKGIGKSRKKALEDMGIFSCTDLINYLPYKFYDFSKTEPFADDGNIKVIKSKPKEPAKLVRAKNNLCFVTCKMTDEAGQTFTAIWYNQSYIKNVISMEEEYFLYGKNSPTKKNYFVVSVLKNVSKLEGVSFLPVYKNASHVGQKLIHDSINFCIENAEISGFTPPKTLLKYNLFNLKDAYKQVHNPITEADFLKAKETIDIENMLPVIASNEFNKNYLKVIKSQQYKNIHDLKAEYEKLLPFTLTSDQQKAIYDIDKDFSSKFAMNRLLQGDVGSGKTVVGFFGAYVAAKSGYQAAIIAPTEILANQHYETAKKIFAGTNIEVLLLTGSIKGIERKSIISKIESGSSTIIIGTHALISDSVNFAKLSYIVIDEQHRFGVEQRAKLKEKGETPDILVMSATPIPRSLALVLYGDLEISTILSRPKASKIVTNIVKPNKFDDMWAYIDGKIDSGSKVYIVCSKIDEEIENDSVIAYSAKSMYNFLKKRFSNREVGLIHGKLSKESQNKEILKFNEGKTQILVSTTIVEVGMDIPDADIMVIATPERFGLATLHQLRGRIGRNGNEARCFCLAENLSEKSYERILFFKNNQNGFDIAEFDLKTRGTGSIYGTNQHGEDLGLSNFSISAYSTACQILEQIKTDSALFAKVIEKGNSLKSGRFLGKIVLN